VSLGSCVGEREKERERERARSSRESELPKELFKRDSGVDEESVKSLKRNGVDEVIS